METALWQQWGITICSRRAFKVSIAATVSGSKVHDTRLVAFMLVHQLSHILTFNVKDFRRFNHKIIPVSPKEITNA
jgi:hypothetical protein